MVAGFFYKWKWTLVKDVPIYEIIVGGYITNDIPVMLGWPIFNNSEKL